MITIEGERHLSYERTLRGETREDLMHIEIVIPLVYDRKEYL
jgi:hypothetical protein